MADSDVIRRGTDSSGRGIYASRFMWDWWDAVVDELGFTPTIVQGAHMRRVGGGAAASAGYHDGGGCFDLRVWDRTPGQVDAIIRVTREGGAGSWLRDHRHGMDPHIHFVLGADYDLAPGARFQWGEYVAGRNGLASRGADYHPRPDPIVVDPRRFMEDDMADYAKQLDRIERAQEQIVEQNRRLLKRLNPGGAIRAKLNKTIKQNRNLMKKTNVTQADLAAIQDALEDVEAELAAADADDADDTQAKKTAKKTAKKKEGSK